jgi:hypothetical protein
MGRNSELCIQFPSRSRKEKLLGGSIVGSKIILKKVWNIMGRVE